MCATWQHDRHDLRKYVDGQWALTLFSTQGFILPLLVKGGGEITPWKTYLMTEFWYTVKTTNLEYLQTVCFNFENVSFMMS